MPANTPRGISYPLYTDPIANTQVYFQDMATDIDGLVEQFSDRLDAAAVRPVGKMSGIANQALAPFTDVTVTWATEDYDNDNMIDLATNNTRIQLTDQGFYIVGACVGTSDAPGTYGVRGTFALTAGIGGGVVSLRGWSNTLDPGPTATTYVNPLMMVYADGVTTVNVTLVMRQNSGTVIQIQDRNMWATKVSNLMGAF